MARRKLVRPLMVKKDVEERKFQTELVEKLHEEWKGTSSILMQVPTGGGKTEIVFRLRDKFPKILFVTSRRNLIDDVLRRASDYGVRARQVNDLSVMKSWPEGVSLVVGHPRAIQNRLLDAPEAFPDLVVLDEAHHAAHKSEVPMLRTNQYTQILGRAINMGCKVLGMTATPWRLEEDLGLSLIHI